MVNGADARRRGHGCGQRIVPTLFSVRLLNVTSPLLSVSSGTTALSVPGAGRPRPRYWERGCRSCPSGCKTTPLGLRLLPAVVLRGRSSKTSVLAAPAETVTGRRRRIGQPQSRGRRRQSIRGADAGFRQGVEDRDAFGVGRGRGGAGQRGSWIGGRRDAHGHGHARNQASIPKLIDDLHVDGADVLARARVLRLAGQPRAAGVDAEIANLPDTAEISPVDDAVTVKVPDLSTVRPEKVAWPVASVTAVTLPAFRTAGEPGASPPVLWRG